MSGHVLDNHSSIPYWDTNLFLLTTVSKVALEPNSIFLHWFFLHGEEQLKNEPGHSCAFYVPNKKALNLTSTPPASSWHTALA